MSWTLDDTRKGTVLVPFDFSDASAPALETARSLAGAPERLAAVHVIPPISHASPAFLVGEADEHELVSHAEEALTKALAEAGFEGITHRIRVGDPASEIIEVARELDAALIVMPSRGKTGLRRWMLGSVTERVVRRAPCPVLVLPLPEPED
jgi:nucleotide-binding universal stress UspA family protein